MRREDWTRQLWATIDEATARPFAWGDQDCCLFAARCVDAMTGSEYERELRTLYHDKASALRFIVTEGGIEPAVTVRFGPPVKWWHAMRGDLCLVPTPDGLGSLGVCVGPTIACVNEDQGVTFVSIDQATACWRVP